MGLNLEPHTCQAGTLPLSYFPQLSQLSFNEIQVIRKKIFIFKLCSYDIWYSLFLSHIWFFLCYYFPSAWRTLFFLNTLCSEDWLVINSFSFSVWKSNFFYILLFICAYKAWVISPPCPHPLPYHPLCPLPLPSPPQYPAETILPLSLILL
jgi:hypothetical protein